VPTRSVTSAVLKFPRLILCLGLILLAGIHARASLAYEGVNLSGAEFGEWNKPGTYGTDYIYPDQTEVDYYLDKGMNTFRLPFLWERLQPSLSAGFDATQLGYISDFVNATTAKGGYVILDPHNFAEYYGGTINGSAFASLWSGLAMTFKDNDHVIFGLMNEPRGGGTISTEAWLSDAQGAMDAIRDTGATNLVLVSGNYYTGAWSWTTGAGLGTANSQVMGAIHDSANNFAFEVHQYFDGHYSGNSGNISHDPVATLSAFTAWLDVEAQEVVHGEVEARDGSGEVERGVRAMPVVAVKEGLEMGGAVSGV